MNDSLLVANAELISDAALWRGMGVLILVLALFLGLVYLVKRFQRTGGHSQLDLEVVGRIGLAPKQFLSVVRVGKEHWVIGVTDASIRYIGEYHPDETSGSVQAHEKGTGRITFTKSLENSMRRFSKPLRRLRKTIGESPA